jgi:hypothetical protein
MKKCISSVVVSFVLCVVLMEQSFPQEKIQIGFWAQAWYQYVENGKNGTEGLNDFILRRAYLYLKGQPTNYFSFFTHIAIDRVGQEGLDSPGMGLGSGIAFRDAWITLHLHEGIKIQIGRMYIPLTRNYGTTSTKALLTTDLSFLQGGVRGTIFYASKVGRDDGVTIWGNPLQGRLQYRFMVSEGVEDNNNTQDHLRLAGRLAVNLLDPEKEWFNKGTYLGEKKVLSFGFGLDTQSDLTINNRAQQKNLVWTADVFFDHPLGNGAITVESAFIHIENSTQAHNFSLLTAGDDAKFAYIQAGYLLPGQIGTGRVQPYMRFETAEVDQKNDTHFWSGGLNYYFKGHDAKISVDYTHVVHTNRDDQGIVTLQFSVGL